MSKVARVRDKFMVGICETLLGSNVRVESHQREPELAALHPRMSARWLKLKAGTAAYHEVWI